MRNKIQAILLTINSRRDQNGNSYHAFRYTDCETGFNVEALADGESTILQAVNNLPHGSTGYYWTQQEHGKRDFKAKCGQWPYAGCNPNEIAAFIKATIKTGGSK